MIYFTSDTHYGHKNIIKYCARPFADIDEMHREMIARWNAVVRPEDTVYHLGDFAFGLKPFVANIVAQLVGEKILIRGNHDKTVQGMRDVGFDEVQDDKMLRLDGLNVYLRHIPVDYTVPLPYGTDVHLCGHVHEAWKVKTWVDRMPTINVGVDQWDFRPVSLQTLLGAL